MCRPTRRRVVKHQRQPTEFGSKVCGTGKERRSQLLVGPTQKHDRFKCSPSARSGVRQDLVVKILGRHRSAADGQLRHRRADPAETRRADTPQRAKFRAFDFVEAKLLFADCFELADRREPCRGQRNCRSRRDDNVAVCRQLVQHVAEHLVFNGCPKKVSIIENDRHVARSD